LAVPLLSFMNLRGGTTGGTEIEAETAGAGQ
jgi:hypothetical protein